MQNAVLIGCEQGAIRRKVKQRVLQTEVQVSSDGRSKLLFCPHRVFTVVP